MERQDIIIKTQLAISSILGLAIEDVTLDTTLADLGADSLDEVEVMMEIESSFDIHIEDDTFNQGADGEEPTVGHVVDVIEQLLADA